MLLSQSSITFPSFAAMSLSLEIKVKCGKKTRIFLVTMADGTWVADVTEKTEFGRLPILHLPCPDARSAMETLLAEYKAFILDPKTRGEENFGPIRAMVFKDLDFWGLDELTEDKDNDFRLVQFICGLASDNIFIGKFPPIQVQVMRAWIAKVAPNAKLTWPDDLPPLPGKTEID